MKKLLLIGLSLYRFTLWSQQLETYDSGSYSDIFYTNQSPIFGFTSAGFNGTRGIFPLNFQYALNYLRRGSFDFSTSNATLTISTLFKIKAPTTTGIGNDALEMGFVQSLTATSFISPGTNGDLSCWIYPTGTTLTNGGYTFQIVADANVYNGSTSAGFSFGTTENPILKTTDWYLATLQLTRSSATTIDFLATIDDYGTNGQSDVGRMTTVYFPGQSGSAPYPFSILNQISTYYPALGGVSNFGLLVLDNTSINGAFTPGIPVSVQTDVELDFQTVIGGNYYIDASPDLIQWTTIEVVAGTGGTVTRYYPTTSTAKFFRVVQD